MAVTGVQLLADAKEAADLTNVTDYVTDERWYRWMSDAVKELHRFVTNKFRATYYRTFDFTIADGDSQVELPVDFWRLRGLDLDPGTVRRRPVLPYNFAERNSHQMDYLRMFGPAIFCADRYYNVLGSRLLQIQPEEHAAGNYRLYYVPKPTLLVAATTVTFNLDSGDTGNVPPTGGLDGTGSWNLLNAAFNHDIPVDGSIGLTLSLNAPNGAFSGTYYIVDIGIAADGFGRPTAGVSNLASVGALSYPLVGTGTYTYRPIGYGANLDPELEPYAEYVYLAAAIKSLTKEESFAQAKLLIDQRNLIRADLTESLEQDQGGPQTIIDTDGDREL